MFNEPHLRRRLLPLVVALAALSGGCGSGGQITDEDTAVGEMPSAFMSAMFTEEGLLVERVDTNLDGAADIWKFFQVLDDNDEPVVDPRALSYEALQHRRLVRKQLDVNQDGAIDVVCNYSSQEDLASEEVDSDFDGVLDRTDTFEAGIRAMTESDHDGDGRVDETRYYRGVDLHRIERDTNGNGIVDQWTYYDGGQLQRIGSDTTGDGDIDTWNRRPAPIATPTTAARPTTPDATPDAEPSEGETTAEE